MIIWVVRGFALVSVVALIIGMAAEFTTFIGYAAIRVSIFYFVVLKITYLRRDLKSVSSSIPFSKSLGIMLAKGSNAAAANRQKKASAIVCEAYKEGTDFSQRPGAIVSASLYHGLSRKFHCIKFEEE